MCSYMYDFCVAILNWPEHDMLVFIKSLSSLAHTLTLYLLKEMSNNIFANRADQDQTALLRAA